MAKRYFPKGPAVSWRAFVDLSHLFVATPHAFLSRRIARLVSQKKTLCKAPVGVFLQRVFLWVIGRTKKASPLGPPVYQRKKRKCAPSDEDNTTRP